MLSLHRAGHDADDDDAAEAGEGGRRGGGEEEERGAAFADLPVIIEPMTIDLSLGGVYVGQLMVDVSINMYGLIPFLETKLGNRQPSSL